ncbi:MAG: phenylacetate-CoA ligase [Candidatus Kentron sp. G]|nr:MAG: phenylacetate-CoA ligase [Candidatus Kentron sp. G]VFN02329.1 MAG: phenylacetate-CoA ligase [Candidatus Kentron sp. G]VFN03730.1 MAG: phenylacetate-CoA ligase [Candidatus Kentron sp. G]
MSLDAVRGSGLTSILRFRYAKTCTKTTNTASTMESFYDRRETRSIDEREAAQLAELQSLLERAKANPLHAQRIGDRSISSLNDLAELPLLRKSDLIGIQAEAPPFGDLNLAEIGRMHHVYRSPGPINDYDGTEPDWWRVGRALYAAGFRPGDIVHNSFSYHFTPAGMLFDRGAANIGCTVFPAGTENTEFQAQAMAVFRASAYTGVPDFLPRLLEKADESALDTTSLTKACVSAGPLFPSVRKGLNGRGIAVYQCYVIADLGLIAYESPALEAMIIDEDVLVEIVRPGTGTPVPDGEVGEVVVTALSHQELPLIRLAIGDLSAIMPGQSPCGRTGKRLRGWLGRADQTVKVRGMFVHPEQVARVLEQCALDARARLVVGREGNRDTMTLHVEHDGPAEGLVARLESTIKNTFNLRGEVRIEPIGALPNDGKVIEDKRDTTAQLSQP